MNGNDASARQANRRRGVLLLDVGVEGVEVDAAVEMADLVDETDGLVERIEVVELETVDDLLGQHDALALGVLRHLAEVLNAALPFVFGGPSTREDAERDLVRAAEDG